MHHRHPYIMDTSNISAADAAYDRAYYRDEVRCFVPSCKKFRRDHPNVTFLPIPKPLKATWCLAVERNCPKRLLYVCEEHVNVEQDCYNSKDGKHHLKETANLLLTRTCYDYVKSKSNNKMKENQQTLRELPSTSTELPHFENLPYSKKMSQTGKRHYCVFGCSISGAYMHAFPHPVRRPEMHKTWVSIVGDKLKGLDPWKIYKNKKICTFHFTPDQKVACHRLIYNAVPCINLSGKVDLAAGPLLVLTEHNYSLLGINGSSISSSEQDASEATLSKDATVTDRSHGVEADELEDQDDVSMYHDDDLIYKTTVSDTDKCYACNECKETITGFRYTCLQCADWDLCGACEARAAHAAHYVLRIPSARPYIEIEAALAAIRRQLLSEGLLPDIKDRVKDVKLELEEPPEIEEFDPLGDCNDGDSAIETDIIPHVIADAELPPRKRPHFLLASPENFSKSSRNRTVAHDNSSPYNHDSTKPVEDIHGRKLANNKPSIPIVKLISQSVKSQQASGRIPVLKPIAEASVPLEMRVIKLRTVAGDPTSRLRQGRQGRPKRSPSEDKFPHQGTDRSTATTTEAAATPTIIPKLERTAIAKASSGLILRVPIGANADVVKALKSKVSVRLKRIDVSKWKCKS